MNLKLIAFKFFYSSYSTATFMIFTLVTGHSAACYDFTHLSFKYSRSQYGFLVCVHITNTD